MTDEQRLIEKFRRIEILFARPGTEGEKLAAEAAREKILARLHKMEVEDPPMEYRFSLSNPWSRRVLIALLRRYGIEPYRYRGQRHTTIMARVSKKFVDDTLLREFEEIEATLQQFFNEFTERVISEALGVNTEEPKERQMIG